MFRYVYGLTMLICVLLNIILYETKIFCLVWFACLFEVMAQRETAIINPS